MIYYPFKDAIRDANVDSRILTNDVTSKMQNILFLPQFKRRENLYTFYLFSIVKIVIHV